MSPIRVQAPAILLFCLGLIGSCDRPPPAPPPVPAPGVSSSSAALKAADAACALPLGRFAPHRTKLTGSFLDYPTNVLLIDRTGGLRWNGEPVEPRRLGEYVASQAKIEPPVVLVIQPARDAPCAAVRETLAAALQAGRCSPQRCAFEWPGTLAPPLLPEPSKLLGDWVLVSIDEIPPPRGADPIEVTFADGEVNARSQCITYHWLIGEGEGRLRLRTPPGPVAMCARATSPWEDRFGAAMASAGYIESAGEQLIVTGPKGKLRLKRLD